MSEQLRAPYVVNVVDLYTFPQSGSRLTVGGYEDVPGFALVIGVVAGDRNGAAEVAEIVFVFAADVEANQFSGLHLTIQVIVVGERGEGFWEDRVLARHYPGPEVGSVGSRGPAAAFDC